MSRRREVKNPQPEVIITNWRLLVILALLLAVGTLAVYWQVGEHEFLQFDDVEYVTENVYTCDGITSQSLRWAFDPSHRYCSNWHPLTWISHMVDIHLFGLDPKGHHLMNVFFHILSTLLLFFALFRMTRSEWKSAIVAALFAIHPLHIESVAWVAERKDTLSTMFWMLTILAYSYYAEKRTTVRYGLVITAFALGLLSKPMLVTLPFVLLLLDHWPLGRMKPVIQKKGAPKQVWPMLVVEKMPLLVMSAFSAYMTYKVQRGAVASSSLTLDIRIQNALVSYVSYIGKMFWPSKLAVVYPHPGVTLADSSLPAVSAVLLVVMTLAVILWRRRRPYMLGGWLWYMGTLVPVIGLVQVGEQGMADRCTYIPLIGLFAMIAWGIPSLVVRRRGIFLGVPAVAIILALTVATWHQLGYWKNSETLFDRTIAVTGPNVVARINLGAYLEKQGRKTEAIAHYKEALKIHPQHVRSLNLLATAYAREGNYEEAAKYYTEALDHAPYDPNVNNNLASILNDMGKPEEAVPLLEVALVNKPNFFQAHSNLGNSYRMLGRVDEAIEEYSKALAINPAFALAHRNMGVALSMKKEFDAAIAEFDECLRLAPDFSFVYLDRAEAYAALGRYSEAMNDLEQAQQFGLEIDPRFLEFLKKQVK